MMMSENQYKVDKKAAEDMYSYILKNEIPLCLVDVVDLLNAFHRDNDKLRIDKLKFENKCLDLQKENEQLQKQVGILQKEIRDFIHLCEVCDVMYHISDECDELI